MPRRARHQMPDDVKAALVGREVWHDYCARPAYQQNDYLGWIGSAKRPETRQKRIDQMLDELGRGGIYMKMDHPPSAKH